MSTPARRSAALKRHDVAAEAKCIKSGKTSAGHALLNYAKESKAGLMVMGAYGHSRLREFVFGGATRAVLEEMTHARPHVALISR